MMVLETTLVQTTQHPKATQPWKATEVPPATESESPAESQDEQTGVREAKLRSPPSDTPAHVFPPLPRVSGTMARRSVWAPDVSCETPNRAPSPAAALAGAPAPLFCQRVSRRQQSQRAGFRTALLRVCREV